MYALSLIQPWASLVMSGAKQVETRSWFTDARGPLVIHASKRMPGDARDLAVLLHARGLLPPVEELPLGAALGEVKLLACVMMPAAVADLRGDEGQGFRASGFFWELTAQELELGHYAEGRYAWLFAKPRPFIDPEPTLGAQGLWRYNGALRYADMGELPKYGNPPAQPARQSRGF
jgi:hypothetical protein